MRYSSSEEGEVEEVPSDHYVFDDEKHRAIHQDLNRETTGLFSSESEIYNESTHHSLSLKNEGKDQKNDLYINNDLIILQLGIFSDEGGHVSDDRPASRESLLNSEPEHEWPDQE